jgi:hypothetical protein
MKVHGACHCGQIRYEAEVDPQKVNLCNCSDCQVLSGSAAFPGNSRNNIGKKRK